MNGTLMGVSLGSFFHALGDSDGLSASFGFGLFFISSTIGNILLDTGVGLVLCSLITHNLSPVYNEDGVSWENL